ncbi:hypothetical protein N665_0472s0026 [Sinapis alba]|nr:hypothetical protein N665_0472s0026 [Sinapis alba]
MSVQRCSLSPPNGGSNFQADPDIELVPSSLHDKIVPILRVAGEVEAAKIMESHAEIEAENKIYVPYNILPLHPDRKNQAIMGRPEVLQINIGAALTAISNTSGLRWREGHRINGDEDILDWLKTMFGFQIRSGSVPKFWISRGAKSG